MKTRFLYLGLFLIFFGVDGNSFPGAPTEPTHPGSKFYSYGVSEKNLKCSGRDVVVFLPTSLNSSETFPAVIYGHGQALGVKNYKATLEHLARKGVAAIYPNFDTGFFDQDWIRMGEDYINLSHCAVRQLGVIREDQIVFSGHSKGAYVASVASGLAFKENLSLKPSSVLLFATAGVSESLLRFLDPSVEMTVVFSDADSIVKRELSESSYSAASSLKKQFIFVKSYGAQTGKAVSADHFWPLTQGSFAGGGPESELHYYGSWKWLVAAALDLSQNNGSGTNKFLFGDQAANKGVLNLTDDIKRSW